MPSHGPPSTPLLGDPAPPAAAHRWILPVILSCCLGILLLPLTISGLDVPVQGTRRLKDWVQAERGVVAADDGRCSEIGVEALKRGGHAVDAAVATAICLGVVNPTSSGIGGGAFMVVRASDTGEAVAFDSRETAPLAASQNMYAKNPSAKEKGALSAGVPGEVAGLHAAWSRFGRLPWSTLLRPSVELARRGFLVSPFLSDSLRNSEETILNDPGLRRVFAPEGVVLTAGETCRNPELARTLEALAEVGPGTLYGGSIGQAFTRDVEEAGGLLTVEDLRRYEVEITAATQVDVMGYTLLGMPPPSSGTVGMAMVLNILDGYGTAETAKGPLGLHRLVEALKHMFALRMELGDPDFVNTNRYVSEMLSPTFADKVRKRIYDNITFDPDYYMTKWSQLRDHGTSHFCIVDADRNAVSMTSTVNSHFGSGMLSPSTGILLNNEMADFSTPTEVAPDKLPPAPANFIQPRKRPLSSMTPLIILKDNQLAGVTGGSGGLCIIPAITQVFLNHFVLGMEPLAAVQSPRIFHRLIPNEIKYENLTDLEGEHIELPKDVIAFLEERGHKLESSDICSVCQLVVHNLQKEVRENFVRRRMRKISRWRGDSGVFYGMLTAVSDPRKYGSPAGL